MDEDEQASKAGQGIKIPPLNSTSLFHSYLLGKTPTTIQYDDYDQVLKVGERPSGNPRLKQHFKTLLPAHISSQFSNSSKSKGAKKLISDYLREFCGDLLQLLLTKECITGEDLKTKWYLTTPGCWSTEDRLNFQELARVAVNALLPGSEVVVDLSESRASCDFLVDNLQLGSGIWALTCDIGGATIDITMVHFPSI